MLAGWKPALPGGQRFREGRGLNAVAEQELFPARESVQGRNEPPQHRLERRAGAPFPAAGRFAELRRSASRTRTRTRRVAQCAEPLSPGDDAGTRKRPEMKVSSIPGERSPRQTPDGQNIGQGASPRGLPLKGRRG